MSQEQTPYPDISPSANPDEQAGVETPVAESSSRSDSPLRATNQFIVHARTEMGWVIAGQRPVM